MAIQAELRETTKIVSDKIEENLQENEASAGGGFFQMVQHE